MLEGALEGTVGFLALLGAVALALRCARASILFLLRTAEIASASGSFEASARRGDLTALGEARGAVAAARARRRRDAALAVGWVSWLVLPLVLGGVPEAWALAAPLWLVPGSAVPRKRR